MLLHEKADQWLRDIHAGPLSNPCRCFVELGP
jgi:hypothetical protein